MDNRSSSHSMEMPVSYSFYSFIYYQMYIYRCKVIAFFSNRKIFKHLNAKKTLIFIFFKHSSPHSPLFSFKLTKVG